MEKITILSVYVALASAGLVSACGSPVPTESDGQGLAVADSTALSCASGAQVSIDANKTLTVLGPAAVGANAAAWDDNLVDAAVPDLLADADIQIMRYPGGSTADNYHWLSNGVDDQSQGGTTASANFDAYMAVAQAAGAEAMITVNYGSGTPEEAADWVRYANQGGEDYDGPVPTYPGASATGHSYGIRYWEIGNELYGDGTYGATWEVNHKLQYKNVGPPTYAEGVVYYSNAMKAVDPSIRIGVVLTAPGNWPDGQVSPRSPIPWNDSVLPFACAAVDFVVIHWYPQGPTGESDAALLGSPQNGETTPVSYTPGIPDMIAALKSKLVQYCGSHASDVQIFVTETNSVSYNPGKQTTSLVNALYLADAIPTWLENGVANVDWWAIHNSPFDGNVDPALDGSYEFGDYGILSRGLTTAGGVAEPPAETPFPAYYAFQMLSRLGHDPGSKLLDVSSSTPLVAVHAVKQTDGDVHALLINKDPTTPYTVSVRLKGISAHGLAEVYSYGIGDSSLKKHVKRVQGSSFSLTLPPYSLTVVALP
jgi:hypothetical protein